MGAREVSSDPARERAALRALAQAIAAVIWHQEIEPAECAKGVPDVNSDGERDDVEPPPPTG
jgi:hypothetical protein